MAEVGVMKKGGRVIRVGSTTVTRNEDGTSKVVVKPSAVVDEDGTETVLSEQEAQELGIGVERQPSKDPEASAGEMRPWQERAKLSKAYSHLLEMNAARTNLSHDIGELRERILEIAMQEGPFLAENRKGVPIVVYANHRIVTRLDKTALAAHLGDVAPQDLTVSAIADYVEHGDLTAKDIEDYETQEDRWSLKTRRATKKDLFTLR